MKLPRINLFFGMCLIHPVAGGWEKFDTMRKVMPDMDMNYRNLATDIEEQNLYLQRLWWNWCFCTSAQFKEEFVPMNSLVPSNTVFLAGFNAACEEAPPTRTGTICAEQTTVFFPVLNSVTAYDLNDDYKLGRDECLTSVAEATYLRFAVAYNYHSIFLDPLVSGKLFAFLDGEPLEIFYLMDDSVPLAKECPDKRTSREFETLAGNPDGDVCDDEPFTRFGGLDYGPMNGWWGSVTRNWVVGDTHTFEFGGGEKDGICPRAVYVLTVEGCQEEFRKETTT